MIMDPNERLNTEHKYRWFKIKTTDKIKHTYRQE